MSLTSELRARFRARRSTDTTTYWAALRALAAPKAPPPKRAAELLDQAEAAARALGRDLAAVERDLATLRELADSERAAAQHDQTAAAARAATAAVATADREAAELEREARRRRETAAAAQHIARAAARTAEEAVARVRLLRGRLAAAGDPAAEAAEAEHAAERRREHLRAELRTLEGEIATFEEVARKTRGDDTRGRLEALGRKRERLLQAIAGVTSASKPEDDEAEDSDGEAEE